MSTASMGKKSGKTSHISCRRCGSHTYHIRKLRCSSCGYGNTATKRKYNTNKKNTK
ncbi:50S ribosomal protein L37e [archaeon]|nr:50S ribosomal protein L37e [archaeon]MBT6698160.1 50S ribosomal protein L37e [archaeon]